MAEENGVVLRSAKAFNSVHAPLSLWTWIKLYWSCVGAIYLSLIVFFDFHADPIALMIFLGVIFAVLFIILKFVKRVDFGKAVTEIYVMKFKLGNQMTLNDVYVKLVSAFPEVYRNYMTFKREADKIIVTYEGITYELILNGDGTFSVIGKNSSLPDKELYERISLGTAIIVYWLQNSFGLN